MCQGPMIVISFIEDDTLIKKILIHLVLWQTHNLDPSQSNNLHTILHTRDCRSSTIGLKNNDDGFFRHAGEPFLKMGKTAIICLVRHTGSKFPDAPIIRH